MESVTFLLWTTYIFLIVIGLFVKRSIAYDALVIFFLGFLAWAATDTADLPYYTRIYLVPNSYLNVEGGWRFLCSLGTGFGLSYNGFASVVTVAATTLLVIFARRATPNESFFLSLFLIYPGLISLVQFRQYVASTIVLIGALILSERKRYGWPVFIGSLVLAFLIHKSSIIVGFVALAPFYSKLSKHGKTITSIALFIALAVLLVKAKEFSFLVFGQEQSEYYLRAASGDMSIQDGGNAISTLGALRNLVFIFGIALLCMYCVALGGKEKTKLWIKHDTLLMLSRFINVAMIALVPFVVISGDFMRFERYGFMFALIIFSYMPYIPKRHVLFSAKAFYVFVAFIFLYFLFLNGGTFDTTVDALLSFEYLPSFFM